MVNGLSSDLQSFIEQTNAERVDVIIRPAAGNVSNVENRLRQEGIDFNTRQAGSITVISATMPVGTVTSLSQSGDVQQIELDQTFSLLGGSVMGIQSGPGIQNATARTLGQTMEQIGIPQAWSNAGHRGQGFKIGVIDTPVDESHPMIAENIAETGGYTNPGDHGTWVAGACAGVEQEITEGVVHGAAPDADLYCYGAFDGSQASASDIIDGMDFMIENDVDVVNMSLGGPHSAIMEDLVIELVANDIVPVVSAGNSGPASGTVSCPGHHEDSLCVAAVSQSGEVAGFSSRGPGSYDDSNVPEVSAPGGDGDRTDQGVVAHEVILGPFAGGIYGPMMGTSMAAPHVTGMVVFSEEMS